MWFSRKQTAKAAIEPTASGKQVTTKRRGDLAEALAREHLERAGLRLLTANFKTPGRGGGEIDLVMADRDGTLVFVEVRQRSSASHGGAGASIGPVKQRRIIHAARHYLLRLASPPPCRFDVVLVEGGPGAEPQLTWLKAAFDASA